MGLAAICVCVRRELREDTPRPMRTRAALRPGASTGSPRLRGAGAQGKHQRLASQEEVTQVELEEELASVEQSEVTEPASEHHHAERPSSPRPRAALVQEVGQDV